MMAENTNSENHSDDSGVDLDRSPRSSVAYSYEKTYVHHRSDVIMTSSHDGGYYSGSVTRRAAYEDLLKPKEMVTSRETSTEKEMDEQTVISKLFRNGRCVWPSCEQAFNNTNEFIRHLDCHHVLDEKGAAQARVQGYVVRELEEKLIYERKKLKAMLNHLQYTNEKGSLTLQKTAYNLSPPPPPSHYTPTHPLPHIYPLPPQREHPGGERLSPMHAPPGRSPSPPGSPRGHFPPRGGHYMPGHHHKVQYAPRYYPSIHPAYPPTVKRESPPQHPDDGPPRRKSKEHLSPPGLVSASHERAMMEQRSGPPMMVDPHLQGPPPHPQGATHMIKMPSSPHDASYHPVRRRGEAAAMVDIGHELRAKGKLFEDPDVRPPYTYASLIRQGVMDSPNGELTLNEIYNWFMKNFAYFRKNTSTWKNAVRHNLSLHKCFVRKENFKGAVWTVDDVEFFRRRMTKPGLPKREYYMPGHHLGEGSPLHDEDDYVTTEEALPSMAMREENHANPNVQTNASTSEEEMKTYHHQQPKREEVERHHEENVSHENARHSRTTNGGHEEDMLNTVAL